MTPIDPVIGASEAFLRVYVSLPAGVRNLIGLSLILTTIVVIIQLAFRFRG